MKRTTSLAALVALAAAAAHGTDAPPGPDAEARVVDRLQLEATAVTGNRELPRVMSIVPWKPAEPPAGPDRPMGSLVEEVLSPLDRDEFRREITYFRDLAPQSSVAGTPAAGPRAASTAPVSAASRPSDSPGESKP